MNINIYTLTSPLHNEESVAASTKEFLGSLGFEYTFKGEDFSDYGSSGLNLIFIRTGGTENLFKKLSCNGIIKESATYLLASGTSNSLAASMEILSWLRQTGRSGEILHGSTQYISSRVKALCSTEKATAQCRTEAATVQYSSEKATAQCRTEAATVQYSSEKATAQSAAEAVRKKLTGIKAAIIGKPSDWLISSSVIDQNAIAVKLGFQIEQIDIEEVEKAYSELSVLSEEAKALEASLFDKCNFDTSKNRKQDSSLSNNIPGAVRIYQALKKVIAEHNINAFTIRCFDLLSSLKNTGCTALAKLNAQGIVAGCEGDAPAMLSMIISQCLTGKTGFQANPARVDAEKGEVLFAHCTIPFNMVERFELDTHFESGIGVGIRGYMKEGPVTVFKVSGNLQRCFIEEGTLLENGCRENLCRTQQLIKFCNKEATRYFLQDPIGNHHIIINGHWKNQLAELLQIG